jgi:hypothetical protein
MGVILYTCIRCDYKTDEKRNMKRHLYEKNKPCQSKKNKIELTDEIKEEIMNNRIYHIPKPVTNISRPRIITNNEEYHYIYIVRPNENVLHNENVYKIGKTKLKSLELNISRLTSYGKGSELVYISQCNNCDILEREVIEEFNKKFNKHTFGTEYFIGNKYEMMKIIGDLVFKSYQVIFEE